MDVNPISAHKTKVVAGAAGVPGASAAETAVDAFASLMRSVGFKFTTQAGLNEVEGQLIRLRPVKDQSADPKPRDHTARPRPDRKDDDGVKAADAAPAAKQTDNDTKDTEDSDAAEAPVAQAAADTTAVDEDSAVVAVAIQFEITIELPNGETQPVAVVDLDTLLGAAKQNPAFGQALQKAVEGALNGMDRTAVDGDDRSAIDEMLNGLRAAVDTDIGQADAGNDDTIDLAGLFRQIINALRPQQAQAKTEAASTAAAQTAVDADAAKDATANAADLRAPEAARQAQDLSRILGNEAKIEIKVVVQGSAAAQVALDLSPFNHFAGYNPAEARIESLANGQTGVAADAPEAAASPEARTASAWAAPAAAWTTLDPAGSSTARNNAGPAGVRGDGAGVKPIEMPAQSNTQSSNQQPGNSFANLMGQNTTTATAKAAAAEQPAATTPDQVIEQIKVNITRAAKAGLDRVTIQLRPAELGRIEIKLEMAKDGTVKALIAADNPATLELLKNESRGMERALQDAGLRADADDLEFSLRGQDSERLGEEAGRDGQRNGGRGAADADALNAENDNNPDYDYALAARMRGGVDTYA